MPRAKRTDIRRVHLTLNSAALTQLEFYFGKSIGVSEAIRIAIARFLRDQDAIAKALIEENQHKPENQHRPDFRNTTSVGRFKDE